eukprot:GHVN01053189.1.p1 GENE.GHVN01053189.1~~GHVN01053189.1.p1  ORF type:complete len:1069 (+),score=341.74 GHVN01053189.1:1343-4549(+)
MSPPSTATSSSTHTTTHLIPPRRMRQKNGEPHPIETNINGGGDRSHLTHSPLPSHSPHCSLAPLQDDDAYPPPSYDAIDESEAVEKVMLRVSTPTHSPHSHHSHQTIHSAHSPQSDHARLSSRLNQPTRDGDSPPHPVASSCSSNQPQSAEAAQQRHSRHPLDLMISESPRSPPSLHSPPSRHSLNSTHGKGHLNPPRVSVASSITSLRDDDLISLDLDINDDTHLRLPYLTQSHVNPYPNHLPSSQHQPLHSLSQRHSLSAAATASNHPPRSHRDSHLHHPPHSLTSSFPAHNQFDFTDSQSSLSLSGPSSSSSHPPYASTSLSCSDKLKRMVESNERGCVIEDDGHESVEIGSTSQEERAEDPLSDMSDVNDVGELMLDDGDDGGVMGVASVWRARSSQVDGDVIESLRERDTSAARVNGSKQERFTREVEDESEFDELSDMHGDDDGVYLFEEDLTGMMGLDDGMDIDDKSPFHISTDARRSTDTHHSPDTRHSKVRSSIRGSCKGEASDGNSISERDESSEECCAVCLLEKREIEDPSVLDNCRHLFCFSCLLKWSEVTNRCPLCKARFNVIRGELSGRCEVVGDKEIKVDEFIDESDIEWYNQIRCIRCNLSDREEVLMLCDGEGCDSACHTYCHTPPLAAVPAGDWFCNRCRPRRQRIAAQSDTTSYSLTNRSLLSHLATTLDSPPRPSRRPLQSRSATSRTTHRPQGQAGGRLAGGSSAQSHPRRELGGLDVESGGVSEGRSARSRQTAAGRSVNGVGRLRRVLVDVGSDSSEVSESVCGLGESVRLKDWLASSTSSIDDSDESEDKTNPRNRVSCDVGISLADRLKATRGGERSERTTQRGDHPAGRPRTKKSKKATSRSSKPQSKKQRGASPRKTRQRQTNQSSRRTSRDRPSQARGGGVSRRRVDDRGRSDVGFWDEEDEALISVEAHRYIDPTSTGSTSTPPSTGSGTTSGRVSVLTDALDEQATLRSRLINRRRSGQGGSTQVATPEAAGEADEMGDGGLDVDAFRFDHKSNSHSQPPYPSTQQSAVSATDDAVTSGGVLLGNRKRGGSGWIKSRN